MPPQLLVSRREAKNELLKRWSVIGDLRYKTDAKTPKTPTWKNSEIEALADWLTQAFGEAQKAHDYNIDLLHRLFSDDSIARSYENGIVLPRGRAATLSERLRSLLGALDEIRLKLESLVERLDLIPEPPARATQHASPPETVRAQPKSEVFVVHGHDDRMLQAVARTLERLSIHPVILHEKANRGKTILEKFEAHSEVEFAVVLFSPDDVGCSKGEEPTGLHPRARQNVVFEFGFFAGKLRRDRVCVLHHGDVEIPSDLHGFVYIAYDEAGGWRIALARELRGAGMAVDLNNL